MVGRLIFAVTLWSRLRGLLGRDPSFLGSEGVLVLVPCCSIHTFGMRHPIDVAFLDRGGHVLKTACALPPNRILNCPGAAVTCERFTAQTDEGFSSWIEVGDIVCIHSDNDAYTTKNSNLYETSETFSLDRSTKRLAVAQSARP